jgi:hypothetical protein
MRTSSAEALYTMATWWKLSGVEQNCISRTGMGMGGAWNGHEALSSLTCSNELECLEI